MTTVSATPTAAAEPTWPALERAVVDLEGGHRRRVARAALGGDVDQVEVAQRRDRGERQRHGDLAAQRRQRHREELAQRPGAVDARGVVERSAGSSARRP